VRDGVLLSTDRFSFMVAEACSGMNSLLSLLVLAAVWTYVAQGSLPARLAVLVSVAPLVILANTARVTLVLLVASWFGQEAALGFFHNASSVVLFGVALTGLFVISQIAGCRIVGLATSS
jgi:exosortase/archaeosortase family protein